MFGEGKDFEFATRLLSDVCGHRDGLVVVGPGIDHYTPQKANQGPIQNQKIDESTRKTCLVTGSICVKSIFHPDNSLHLFSSTRLHQTCSFERLARLACSLQSIVGNRLYLAEELPTRQVCQSGD